eukprot:COSAG06_NODE_29913_length_548_cov_1.258352_1_plen_87_part_10
MLEARDARGRVHRCAERVVAPKWRRRLFRKIVSENVHVFYTQRSAWHHFRSTIEPARAAAVGTFGGAPAKGSDVPESDIVDMSIAWP